MWISLILLMMRMILQHRCVDFYYYFKAKLQQDFVTLLKDHALWCMLKQSADTEFTDTQHNNLVIIAN